MEAASDARGDVLRGKIAATPVNPFGPGVLDAVTDPDPTDTERADTSESEDDEELHSPAAARTAALAPKPCPASTSFSG